MTAFKLCLRIRLYDLAWHSQQQRKEVRLERLGEDGSGTSYYHEHISKLENRQLLCDSEFATRKEESSRE